MFVKETRNIMSDLIDRVGFKERKYIMEVLENNFKTSKGSIMMKRLEESFCKKFNINYAISHINGTATLHTALNAAKVGFGDEVIVPPLTMSSTTFAVLHNNAIPVFADINPETFNISPESIEKLITSKTKAIMPVSLYGLPCEIDKIMEIAKKHNLIVIEDNAQCFLGKYNNRIAGSECHMASYSFQSSKHMTCGEGGMLTTNDPDLANRIRQFSSLGYIGVDAKKGKITKEEIQDPNYERHASLGWNYRMSELCSAVALGQLENLETLVNRRIDCANLFNSVIEDCSWLVPQKVYQGYESSYWAFAVKIDDSKVSWHQFRNKFRENGGDGIYGVWKLTYMEPVFQNMNFESRKFIFDNSTQKYTAGLCPNAEYLQPRILQFKTNYWDWQKAEVQRDILKKTIKKLS